MFNGNNSTPFSMPVMPAGYGNGNMGGWGDDWIALAIIAMIFGGGGFGGFGGWGGGLGAMEMFLPFLFWGNGGFGGFGGNNGSLTRADLCSEFNFNNLESAVRGVQQGICDSTFALNNTITSGFAGINNAVCDLGYAMQNGFNATQVANMQGNFALQNAINDNTVAGMQNTNALQAQLSSCCCDNRVGQMQLGNSMERGFCDTNYNAATNTTAIIQNAHNDTDRVLAKLDAMEMARKDETIADLRTKLAACGDQSTAEYVINRLSNVINPPAVPAYPAASPCGLGNWNPQVLANSYGYNNGCNSGCCGCNG